MLGLDKPLSSSFSYIFPEDSAVDRDHPDFDEEAYEEDLDRKHLPIKEGERPTVFECKPLNRIALTTVMELVEQKHHNDASQVTVAYGLQRIVDGPPVDLTNRDRGNRLKTKTLDELFDVFGFAVFARLGGIIMMRSTVSPF